MIPPSESWRANSILVALSRRQLPTGGLLIYSGRAKSRRSLLRASEMRRALLTVLGRCVQGWRPHLRQRRATRVVKSFTGPHVFVLGEQGPSTCSPLEVANGNLQVFDNAPTIGLQVAGTGVAQNLQVYKTCGAGFKAVQDNGVGDTIQCFDNDPPFTGGPNTAQKAEDSASEGGLSR
jgi:hypothetical protein